MEDRRLERQSSEPQEKQAGKERIQNKRRVIYHENTKEEKCVVSFSCFPDFACPVADPEQGRREQSRRVLS